MIMKAAAEAAEVARVLLAQCGASPGSSAPAAGRPNNHYRAITIISITIIIIIIIIS